MIKKILVAGSFFLLIACVLYGCSSLQKSSKNLDVSIASTTNASQPILYTLAVTDASSEAGFHVTITPAAVAATATSRLLYSTNSRSFVTPQINFNRIQVKYTVAEDTNGKLNGYTPAALDTGINVVIPRSSAASGSGEGSVSSSTTISLNDISSYDHGLEIFGKIGKVTATAKGDGTFSFTIGLTSIVVVRADVTLSGADEYGNAVSCGFSTSIDYSTTQ
jgi:hypothetical protein